MLGDMWVVKVIPDQGEPFVVRATSRDIYQWESGGAGRNVSQLRNMQFTAMYQVAHIVARRQQSFTGSLQEFLDSCDLDFVDEEDDVGEEASIPTSGGVSDSA